MRLHRFYVGDTVKLTHDFWLNDTALIHQWQKVLRLSTGAEVVLFDGTAHDRLYKIELLEKNSAHLRHVTDFDRLTPKKDVYLFWSLLKKDKNDWVLQKATELGVSHFVPLLANRSEKTGFDAHRARKIVIEAAEQCGRSDIPTIREPMLLQTALNDYATQLTFLVAQQGGKNELSSEKALGILIGPEGGWSDEEKSAFQTQGVMLVGLGDFTLRAETAAIVAAAKLLQ